MLTALIFYTCTVAGTGCTYHVQYDNIPNQSMCQVLLMTEAAKWQGEHPNRVWVLGACTPVEDIAYYIGRNEA